MGCQLVAPSDAVPLTIIKFRVRSGLVFIKDKVKNVGANVTIGISMQFPDASDNSESRINAALKLQTFLARVNICGGNQEFCGKLSYIVVSTTYLTKCHQGVTSNNPSCN